MSYVINIDSVDKTSIVLAKTLKVSPRADERNSCSFTVKTTAGSFLPRVGMDVQVVDGDETVFGGIITNAPQERPGTGTGDTTTIYVEVMASGYSVIPARRVANLSYSSKTCGYIANDMITQYLTSDGITAGTINDGTTLDSYSAEGKSIKMVLDELADISGFKWYIDNDKELMFVQDDSVTNMISNGDFSDGTTGWGGIASTLSAENNILSDTLPK